MLVSVLQRASRGFIAEPFPHADWITAVDPKFYAELSDGFPIEQFSGVLHEDNTVHRLGSQRLLNDPSTKRCWCEFIEHLTSGAFWHDLIAVFGAQLRAQHPHLEQKIGRPLEEWRVCTRDNAVGDVVLEAFAVINTPVRTKPSHVKGPHIDTADKLWTGLLYMRAQDDDTPGGDLFLHRPKGNPAFDRHQIPRAMTEVATTVPYQANRFVGFVNGLEAIHSVAPRPVTSHVRRYVDLVVELPSGKAFEVPQMNPLQRIAYRLSGQRERTR